MPAKMARSASRPPSGLPEVTVAVRIALLPCRKAGKPRVFTAVRESSGESRSNTITPKGHRRRCHIYGNKPINANRCHHIRAGSSLPLLSAR